MYELPPNVKEVEEVFLDDALRLHGEQQPVLFHEAERAALRELVRLGHPDWDVLFRLFQEKGVHPLSFLQSRDFMELFTDICLKEYPYVAYADAFHTMRSMLLPVLYLLTGRVPKADVYHAISTGYGGLLACLGGTLNITPMPPHRARHLHPGAGGGDHPGRVGGALVQEPLDPVLLYAVRRDLPGGRSGSAACSTTPAAPRSRWAATGPSASSSPTASSYQRFCDIPLKAEDGMGGHRRGGASGPHQGRQDHDLRFL